MAKYLHQIQVQCKEKQMLKKQQQLETTASSDDQPHGSTNSPVDSNTSSVDAKCYEIAKSSEDLPAKLGVKLLAMIRRFLVFDFYCFLGAHHRCSSVGYTILYQHNY